MKFQATEPFWTIYIFRNIGTHEIYRKP